MCNIFASNDFLTLQVILVRLILSIAMRQKMRFLKVLFFSEAFFSPQCVMLFGFVKFLD